MWTTWILTSAVFLALYDVAKKASVKGNAVLPVLLVSSACGLAAYLAGLAASGQMAETVLATTPRTVAFADWLYFHGLAIPGVPISVGSLMRRFSVVITFLLGAKFFHETNLRRKGLALAAIVAGIALMAI